ncbi:MAG: PEP-utilizing enzyme, mobile region [Deltaproteobacteria bacterium]|nr:PEP-utilizing enzyme, mobile region [Deltaproteobacteria bacterium]MBW2016493.1 PEP-utilizing enzyme, mobile region [Deltaproteobacteria bacterium]MBW2128497.1 PEP-utilizing enzyme, mobile region [Deltaproteobacteria bacterium]MBW2303644.1 PEP-utilizing enzyme, mobile region [Deltaproteobacteria bacterium]
MAEKRQFPFAEEVVLPPELEGWEEMYPPQRLFSEDRAEWEKKHFWYQDKIHAPEPMYPLDDIFQEAWQIALSQFTTRVFCIPPAQGIAQRMFGCYMYICAIEPPPGEVIQQKAELFEKRVPYTFQNYLKQFEVWLERFQKLGKDMQQLHVPEELPDFVPEEEVIPIPKGTTDAYDLIESFNTIINMIFKAWQYHFQYLNLAYLAYLMFVDTARKLFPGIKESTIGKMVAGAEVSMFRPEEELCRLSRLAAAKSSVKEILKGDASAADKMNALKNTDEGREWLEELEKVKDPWFFVSCGSGWYHYEGSWINKMDVPFSYLQSYINRLEKGEKIERNLNEISEERERLVSEYKALIKSDDDRKSFEDAYNVVRSIYRYAEDHLFWVEHWLHTIWFEKIRQFGNILTKYDLLQQADDIYLFNRFEIPMLLEDLATAWACGVGVPARGPYWKKKADKRRKILEAARKWNPVPALGVPPEEVSEPFTLMLWGVTTDKVDEWLKGSTEVDTDVTEIKGFASSAGVAEGPARVLKMLGDVVDLKPGEIMVAPSTNPSWAPVFTKIKAAVTDIGGLTSHAAIVSREYGLPSVTGTGVATTVIKTGDIIRVDGSSGTVTIVKRA